MKTITFVLYRWYFVAGDGDDDHAGLRIVRVRTRTDEGVESWALNAAQILSQEANDGRYVQVWDIS